MKPSLRKGSLRRCGLNRRQPPLACQPPFITWIELEAFTGEDGAVDIRTDISETAALTDPRAKAQRAHRLVTELSDLSSEATRVRREALEELIHQEQLTQSEVATQLGVSRARVSQLLKSGPRPERAFLGFGELTVVLGGKQEGNKSTPGPVVSTDDLGAYSLLTDTAHALGLSAHYEVVQPNGMVDLNRDNLIVACGPRLSPLIEQVLMADRHLGFSHDEDGWYLHNKATNESFRSPMDSGENIDFGYIARLPRFDSSGTFLYSAGIHAPGVSGGLHYIINNMADLYEEVDRERFSKLIQCEFDPETRQILSSEALTPTYKHEQVRR